MPSKPDLEPLSQEEVKPVASGELSVCLGCRFDGAGCACTFDVGDQERIRVRPLFYPRARVATLYGPSGDAIHWDERHKFQIENLHDLAEVCVDLTSVISIHNDIGGDEKGGTGLDGNGVRIGVKRNRSPSPVESDWIVHTSRSTKRQRGLPPKQQPGRTQRKRLLKQQKERGCVDELLCDNPATVGDPLHALFALANLTALAHGSCGHFNPYPEHLNRTPEGHCGPKSSRLRNPRIANRSLYPPRSSVERQRWLPKLSIRGLRSRRMVRQSN